MKEEKIGPLTQLTAEDGKYIHKLNTDIYVRTIGMLPSENIEMYEEVEEIPPYTEEEYDAKVAAMVREKYSESEEFAIQRKAINAAFSPSPIMDADTNPMEEYQRYNAYVEECKLRAKDASLYKVHDEISEP